MEIKSIQITYTVEEGGFPIVGGKEVAHNTYRVTLTDTHSLNRLVDAYPIIINKINLSKNTLVQGGDNLYTFIKEEK